jgi:hypothetical protein
MPRAGTEERKLAAIMFTDMVGGLQRGGAAQRGAGVGISNQCGVETQNKIDWREHD